MAKTSKITKFLTAALLLLPASVLAAGLDPALIPVPAGLPGDSATTASGTILRYTNIALSLVGIIAVAFLIYGGFRYITSAGNEEAAEGGKKIITNAIIGLVVIIFSYVIVTVIVNALARQTV